MHPHKAAPKVVSHGKVAEPEPQPSGVEVHLCGPGRELLDVIRLEPEQRRFKIARGGHHYEHFDTIANDVWRYAQVD